MAKWLKLYATYTFSTSPKLRHRTTLLNTDVRNCHITLEFIILTQYLTTELSHSKLKYGLFNRAVPRHIGSTLSEFMLEMCPACNDKCI